jgi:hypothetical protein
MGMADEPRPAAPGDAAASGERAASRRRRPTLDERDAFLLKLIEFRRDLPPRQQRMLDAMAVAAFCEHPDEVPSYAARPLADLPRQRDDTPWMNILGAGI